jgi:large subunit ribosomal protein L22
MAVTVKLNFVRHSARKIQPVARIFRGKSLEKSIQESSLMSQHSAHFLNKAFKMAKAAAAAKEFNTDKLVIAAISATTGPKIRRVRPNARGRANAYKKHLAHILVTVDELKNEKPRQSTKKENS